MLSLSAIQGFVYCYFVSLLLANIRAIVVCQLQPITLLKLLTLLIYPTIKATCYTSTYKHY